MSGFVQLQSSLSRVVHEALSLTCTRVCGGGFERFDLLCQLCGQCLEVADERDCLGTARVVSVDPHVWDGLTVLPRVRLRVGSPPSPVRRTVACRATL